MLDKIVDLVANEFKSSVNAATVLVQQKILRIVFKTFLAVAGVSATLIGLILWAGPYVGYDVVVLIVGILALLIFFLL